MKLWALVCLLSCLPFTVNAKAVEESEPQIILRRNTPPKKKRVTASTTKPPAKTSTKTPTKTATAKPAKKSARAIGAVEPKAPQKFEPKAPQKVEPKAAQKIEPTKSVAAAPNLAPPPVPPAPQARTANDRGVAADKASAPVRAVEVTWTATTKVFRFTDTINGANRVCYFTEVQGMSPTAPPTVSCPQP